MSNSTIHLYYKPNYPQLSTSKILSICSEYGPIKKSNTVKTSSNATSTDNNNNNTQQHQHVTITYLNAEDANAAADNLLTQENNYKKTIQENGLNYIINKVSSQAENDKQSHNRIIVRNVSFYATDKDIRIALENKYGSINNIHLPLIPRSTRNEEENDMKKQKKSKQQQHRGFAFVVFDNYESANDAVKDKVIAIKKRECNMEFSERKEEYQRRKKEKELEEITEKEETEGHVDGWAVGDTDTSKEGMEDTNDNALVKKEDEMDESDDEESSDSSSSSSSDSSSSEEEEEEEEKEPRAKPNTPLTNAIFLHNLPFTTTRNDVQELFKAHGTIQSVYFPKDSHTNQMKGSAFVYFDDPTTASTILQLYNNQSSSDDNVTSHANTLIIQGRSIQVSAPFSNPSSILHTTANSDNNTIQKNQGDKRHLYLQYPSIPSRPEDDDINIPPSDKQKRTTSKKERNIKLRSPLFIINPKRLSIRNLSKRMTTIELKQLISNALQYSLENDMVDMNDAILHYKALGYTINQIRNETKCTIPPYNNDDDSKLTNTFITNVQILKNEDTSTTKEKKKISSSKGFAFVDFEYHVHALAVLRQLDNNIMYSKEHAQGGMEAYSRTSNRHHREKNKKKKKEDQSGIVGYPRLIVEFAVENKAKMIKHALSQQKKQLQKKDSKNTKKVKKLSRGQKQREQKRKRQEQNETEKEKESSLPLMIKPQPKKNKVQEKEIVLKPPKKKPKNENESEFDTLVSTYKQQLFSHNDNTNKLNQMDEDGDDNTPIAAERKKRWFEEDD